MFKHLAQFLAKWEPSIVRSILHFKRFEVSSILMWARLDWLLEGPVTTHVTSPSLVQNVSGITFATTKLFLRCARPCWSKQNFEFQIFQQLSTVAINAGIFKHLTALMM